MRWLGGFLKIFSGLLACLLMAVAVLAEEPDSDVIMDDMVVTGNQQDSNYRIGDVDLEQTPGFYSVIRREEFEGRILDLSTVIEKVEGVQVRQSGGLGSFSTVSLRGSSSAQVLVFLDGILLNDASGGGIDLSTVSLEDVDAIEIYRGAAPVNFGQTSIGGVINIRTKRSTHDMNAHVSAGYGSFNTKTASVFLNHKPGRWDYLLSADYSASDNDFDIHHDNRTPLNPNDDYVEERHNAGFNQSNFLCKVGYDTESDLRIELLNQYFNKDQEIPSRWNFDTTQTTFDTSRLISALRLSAGNMGGSGINISGTVHHTWKEEQYDDSQGSVGLNAQNNIYQTRRTGTDLLAEWLTDRHALIAVLEFSHDTYETEDKLEHNDPFDSSRDFYSLAVQDAMYLFGDRLVVTPALRYTHIHDELKSAVDYDGLSLEGETRTNDDVSSQIGLKWSLNSIIDLKANAGRYVRYPSFSELFGDRGAFEGNEDLVEEKGINTDVGITMAMVFDRGIVNSFLLGCAVFYSDVKDIIAPTYDARGIGRYENSNEAQIQGVESNLNLRLLNHVGVSANATYLDSEIDHVNKVFDGKQVAGIFSKTGMVRLEMFFGSWTAYTSVFIGKDMYWDTANSLKAEDKDELNAGLEWGGEHLNLSFEVRNLTDDIYEAYYAYPLPGRAYYIKAKYSY